MFISSLTKESFLSNLCEMQNCKMDHLTRRWYRAYERFRLRKAGFVHRVIQQSWIRMHLGRSATSRTCIVQSALQSAATLAARGYPRRGCGARKFPFRSYRPRCSCYSDTPFPRPILSKFKVARDNDSFPPAARSALNGS